jgi:hypothetical protein
LHSNRATLRGFTDPFRSLVESCRKLVLALDRRAVQLDATSNGATKEVSAMAKKDDGKKEIKKGKESER